MRDFITRLAIPLFAIGRGSIPPSRPQITKTTRKDLTFLTPFAVPPQSNCSLS